MMMQQEAAGWATTRGTPSPAREEPRGEQGAHGKESVRLPGSPEANGARRTAEPTLTQPRGPKGASGFSHSQRKAGSSGNADGRGQAGASRVTLDS